MGRLMTRCLIPMAALLLTVAVALEAQWVTNGSDINNTNAGNVGIGTTSPQGTLTVHRSGPGASRNFEVTNTITSGTSTVRANLFEGRQKSTVIATPGAAGMLIQSGLDPDATNNQFTLVRPWVSTNNEGHYQIGGIDLYASNHWDSSRRYMFVHSRDVPIVFTANSGISNTSVTEQVSVNAAQMVLTTAGNLGIGTTSPSSRLDVNGDVTVNGNIAAKYQDLAEWVPSRHQMDAATVVVLDPDRSNHVMPSQHAYDTRVAGVISAQPGVLLGEGGPGQVVVATTGRVRVKASAVAGPIGVGDLLVTSDREGVAMRSIPVDIGGTSFHRPGTLIGKALEPLDVGVGDVLVLLSLQ